MPEQQDPTPEQLIAAATAGFDQMKAASLDLAGLLVAFREKLVAGGFAEEVADQMAAAYYQLLLGQMIAGMAAGAS